MPFICLGTCHFHWGQIIKPGNFNSGNFSEVFGVRQLPITFKVGVGSILEQFIMSLSLEFCFLSRLS